MAFFNQILSDRGFIAPNGDMLAIYHQCRTSRLYAPVGVADEGNVCFAGEPRAYFPDKVSETRSGSLSDSGRAAG
jgi:hypothetical protein